MVGSVLGRALPAKSVMFSVPAKFRPTVPLNPARSPPEIVTSHSKPAPESAVTALVTVAVVVPFTTKSV